MPGFAFRKERFHPHLSLPHRFFVARSSMVGPDPVQIELIKTPTDDPPLLTCTTLGLERAGSAGRSRRLLCDHPFRGNDAKAPQGGALWTDVDILVAMVGKGLLAKTAWAGGRVG